MPRSGCRSELDSVAEATASILARLFPSGLSLYEWMREQNGIYHLTSTREASRYNWLSRIWNWR